MPHPDSKPLPFHIPRWPESYVFFIPSKENNTHVMTTFRLYDPFRLITERPQPILLFTKLYKTLMGRVCFRPAEHLIQFIIVCKSTPTNNRIWSRLIATQELLSFLHFKGNARLCSSIVTLTRILNKDRVTTGTNKWDVGHQRVFEYAITPI